MSQASVSGSGIPKVESLAQDNEVLVEAGGQVRRASLTNLAQALGPDIPQSKQLIDDATELAQSTANAFLNDRLKIGRVHNIRRAEESGLTFNRVDPGDTLRHDELQHELEVLPIGSSDYDRYLGDVPVNAKVTTGAEYFLGAMDPVAGENISSMVSRAIERLESVGGGTLHLPYGEFEMGEVDLPDTANVIIRGSGSGRYTMPNKSITKLRRAVGATYMFSHRGSASGGGVSQFSNLAIIGQDRNDLKGSDDPLEPSAIIWQQAKRGKLDDIFIENFYRGLDGGDSNPMGGVDVRESVIRACQYNIYKAVDSRFYDTHITGARKYGVLLDSGQNRIVRCFFEFDRSTDSRGLLAKMSTSIVVGRNSSEVVISQNVFDRCAGPLIEIEDYLTSAGVHKRPKYIMISGNHFKRNGWGSETSVGDVPTDSDRATIVCRGYKGACDQLLVHGNQWQASDSEPSEAGGIFSPLVLADLGSANVIWKDNDTSGAPPFIDVVFGKNLYRRYAWERVGASNEWMLIDGGTGKNSLLIQRDPEIEAPDWVCESLDLGKTLSELSSGTAGSLSAGQFAFSSSGEGFDTVFVRMSDDSDPNNMVDLVRLGYNKAQFLHDGATVQDDTYLTRIFKTVIAAGSSKTFTLKTRRHLSTTRQTETLNIDLFAQQSGTAQQGGAQLVLQSFRGTSPIGTIQVRSNTNLGSLTVTGAGGNGDLEFDISNIHPNNEQFDLTVSNTTANGINIEGGVR